MRSALFQREGAVNGNANSPEPRQGEAVKFNSAAEAAACVKKSTSCMILYMPP